MATRVDCENVDERLFHGEAFVDGIAVARIWTPVLRLDYVMSLSSKPVGYEGSGATVDEESHQAGMCSESSLSCEIAACA